MVKDSIHIHHKTSIMASSPSRSLRTRRGFALSSRLLLPLLFLVLGSFVYNLRETVDLNAYMQSVRDTYDTSFGAPPSENNKVGMKKKLTKNQWFI